MSEYLRQVALERRSDRGVYADVAWIEPALARVGKRVRVDNADGSPGEVWTVVEIYGTRRRELIDANRSVRKHMSEVIDGETFDG